MAVTYILTADTGRVRLYANDTNTSQPAFTDEEWQVFLDQSQENNPKLAAAWGLRTLARDIVRLGHWKEAGVSADAAANEAIRLAIWLEKQAHEVDGVAAAMWLGIPFLGGVSRADVDTRLSDDDRIRSAFARDMHTHGRSTTGGYNG